MENEIINKTKKASKQKKLPDDTLYNSICVDDIGNIASRQGVEKRFVEIAALEAGIVPERYVRNMKTFSPQDQATLLNCTVCVVGLGGLGGVVLEILARIGIGTLKLIDGDKFEDSNLNRQFLSSHETMGESKTEAAFKRVKNINSSVSVCRHCEYLNGNNAGKLLDGSDVIVDCLDNLPTRFILEKASKNAGIPFVSAAVAGLSGHVTTIFPQDKGLELIYGPCDQVKPKGAETILGCQPQAVTLLASLETSEVVKILLTNGPLLRNRLLVIDLKDNILQVLDL